MNYKSTQIVFKNGNKIISEVVNFNDNKLYLLSVDGILKSIDVDLDTSKNKLKLIR